MFRSILLIGALLFSLLPDASAAVFPLRTSDNGRFLIDQKGESFLVVGDTAWSLIAQLSEDDIDHYLNDRQKRGFNSIIVNLIEHKFSTIPPKTLTGLAPFTETGGFSTPNPAYFDFAHEVVKRANQRGIVVWLFPAYLGYGGGDQGFFREMKASGKESLRRYGRFVGKKFRDLPNIVWVMGGDFTPKQDDQWVVAEMAEGIQEEDATHLMTGHGSPKNAAVVAFGEQRWLTINTVYSYEKTLFCPIQSEYKRRPIRPFVLIESTYEGEHNSTPDQIRRQAYWAMLGGACGQFFGNNPLSDQENKGGWMKFEPMSDEFNSDGLDLDKWNLGIAPWKGRQPALFSNKNVTVSDGKLHLTMRKEEVAEEFTKHGYRDYTSAALHTKAKASYGYYETKAKPMNSGGSSSFWFKRKGVPGWVTEIDVFEIGGKAPGFESKMNMNVHVFRTPNENEHWSVGGKWIAPWRLADDYHVYGLEWTPDEIKNFVDGVVVRTVENTHWHQPLSLIFDSETMPDWFGMPDDEDLPSTFSIEYVRAWKKK